MPLLAPLFDVGPALRCLLPPPLWVSRSGEYTAPAETARWIRLRFPIEDDRAKARTLHLEYSCGRRASDPIRQEIGTPCHPGQSPAQWRSQWVARQVC